MPDLAALVEFLRRARTASLLVAAAPEGGAPGLVVQRLGLHDDLAVSFLDVARDVAQMDRELRPYDPGYKPEPGELVYIPIAESDAVSSVVGELQHVHQADPFLESEEVIKRLRFYAIVVGGHGGRQAVFFRSYNPKKELSRHAAYALMLRRGQYSRVREKIFLFDEDVDCFAWDGTLFVRNVASFQRIFGYFEELRAKARQTVRAIHRRVPIANLAVFEEACAADTRMLTKLAAIARRPYLARVTFADVERTIRNFELDIEVASHNGAKSLVFDPAQKRRWLILKLMDDDFLGSEMTNEKYEANSKTSA